MHTTGNRPQAHAQQSQPQPRPLAAATPIPTAAPFSPSVPIRSLQDVQRLETRPLAEALPVQSTYDIFVNSAAAFGDKTALTFLPTADPADEPIRWTYAQLLAGIHQTAYVVVGERADDTSRKDALHLEAQRVVAV